MALRPDENLIALVIGIIWSSTIVSLYGDLRRLHLERLGWSVAAYSWGRLERLIERKALFAQHLKLEALVVEDDDDRLKHMLSLYSPAADYRADIDATGAVILAAVNGSLPVATGNWAFDLLAVNVRNLAILALASCGEYQFGYEQALSSGL